MVGRCAGATVITDSTPYTDPREPDRIKVTVRHEVSIDLNETQSVPRCGVGAELARIHRHSGAQIGATAVLSTTGWRGVACRCVKIGGPQGWPSIEPGRASERAVSRSRVPGLTPPGGKNRSASRLDIPFPPMRDFLEGIVLSLESMLSGTSEILRLYCAVGWR